MKGLTTSLCVAAAVVGGIASPLESQAGEIVQVKYRWPVDLAPFGCEWVERSSVVKRLCYDPKEKYVIVNLTGTYYHYCQVPAVVVTGWRAAESMGRFFNANVKGNFDCRTTPMPSYSK